MPISSRTPKGLPNRCPVCGEEVIGLPSQFVGRALCLACGSWLSFKGDPSPPTLSDSVWLPVSVGCAAIAAVMVSLITTIGIGCFYFGWADRYGFGPTE